MDCLRLGDSRQNAGLQVVCGEVRIDEFLQEAAEDALDLPEIATLYEAIQRNDRAAVERLLANGAEVDEKDPDGKPLLVLAARLEDAPLLGMLLDRSKDINAASPAGLTALHSACIGGWTEGVELLLAKGTNLHKREDKYNATPLCIASNLGHKPVVELLLAAGARLDVKDNEGHTPLQLAENAGHKEVAQLLREHGAKE